MIPAWQREIWKRVSENPGLEFIVVAPRTWGRRYGMDLYERIVNEAEDMRLVDGATGEPLTWEFLASVPTKAQCMVGPEDEVAEENQQAANPDTGDKYIELPEPGVLDG